MAHLRIRPYGKEVSHWKIAGGQLEGKCLNALQISAFKVGEGQIVSLPHCKVFLDFQCDHPVMMALMIREIRII